MGFSHISAVTMKLTAQDLITVESLGFYHGKLGV